jgi:hypothetical protein
MATYLYQKINIPNPAKTLPVDVRARKKGSTGGFIVPENLIKTAPPVDTKIIAVYANNGNYLGYLNFPNNWVYSSAYKWGGKANYTIKSSSRYSSPGITFSDFDGYTDVLEAGSGNTALRLIDVTFGQDEMVDVSDETSKINATLEALNAALNGTNLNVYNVHRLIEVADKFGIIKNVRGPADEAYQARTQEIADLQQKYMKEYITNLIAAVQDKLDVQNTGKELSADYGFDIT